MSAAAAWIAWLALASIHTCVLVPVVLCAERLGRRRLTTPVRAALWTAVLLRLIVPVLPGSMTLIAVPLPLAGTVPAADVWSVAGIAPALVLAVWSLGAVLCIGVAVTRHRRARREIREADCRAPDAIVRAARHAAEALGLRRVPRLALSRTAHMPYVAGLWHPVVVLPRRFPATGVAIEHVLMHEFAHVRRRDTLAAALSLAVQIVYWFHPLVWVAARRLSTLRELACDAAAAAAAGSPAQYRRTLLEMARPLAAAPAGPGFFGRGSDLLTRVRALESPVAAATLRQRAGAAALAVLFAAGPALTLGYSLPGLDSAEIGDAAGCLRLRYAVYAALAREAGSAHEPGGEE